SSAFAASLNGTWQGELLGQPLALTLGANGQGVLDDAPIRYQIMGNTLLIDDAGEVNAYQFRQQGDTLVVTGGDLPGAVTLTRGKGKTAKAESAAVGKNVGGATEKSAGGIRPELVGKWCQASTFLANGGGGSQSSACFELRANGSYSYASERSMDAYGGGAWGGTNSSSGDSGRWTATNNSITAQSGNGQTTTYRLEKKNHPKNRDPMLCLDGECYVTYWQKAPW
ncbi:MAG: hypothetical protein REI12_06710, partial [Pedobacter sp.]|nr:hypothetical protein [Pedobacter sp.]